MSQVQEILNIDEHRSCAHYRHDPNDSGFRYLKVSKDEVFTLENLSQNHLFCFLKGRCNFESYPFKSRVLRGGEMMLIPHKNSCYIRAIQDTELLVLSFEAPHSGCARLTFENYIQYASQITYDFSPSPIKPPLRQLLKNIHFYLQAGMNCEYLHEIKHQEFLLVLRGFYTKQEIAQLFYPLVGKSLDFRNKILSNYHASVSVSDLILTSGLSRSSFFVHFKQEFGMTAKEWLANRVRQELVQLASNRQLSIKQIMYNLNFDSPQQFNRFCKHNFGQAPSQFIRQIRGETSQPSEPRSIPAVSTSV